MANKEKLQRMLTLMEQQMNQIQALHNEIIQLRNTTTTNNTIASQRPTWLKNKTPDRPVIDANTGEQVCELFDFE